jgi:putative Mg2+ transporter-C (MgtC) family protein
MEGLAELLDASGTIGEELVIALRLGLAALFGAVLGYERETAARPAGLRTHMLTALAAAVFTVITFEIFDAVRTVEGGAGTDPIRVIEAVTSGVAFLAAGTIIQSRGRVRGLTTGASIWMAGSLGVAAGAGFYMLAVIAVLLSLVILAVLTRLERRITRGRERASESE